MAASTPSQAAAAPDLEQIATLAEASHRCSLTYFQSINFNPSQQQAIIQRGKFDELVADAKSLPIVPERAESDIQLMVKLTGKADQSRQAESYLMWLQSGPEIDRLSRTDQVRAIAYDAYYEAMGAPPNCAPDPRVLQFIGKPTR